MSRLKTILLIAITGIPVGVHASPSAEQVEALKCVAALAGTVQAAEKRGEPQTYIQKIQTSYFAAMYYYAGKIGDISSEDLNDILNESLADEEPGLLYLTCSLEAMSKGQAINKLAEDIAKAKAR